MTALSEEFLSSLVAELVGPNTIAVVLGRSHVRGEATRWSDVDILHLMTDIPYHSEKDYQFTSGHLVSIATRTLAWYQTMLTRPQQAIFIVPALGEARSLFDPQEKFYTFQQLLRGFNWLPLGAAANHFASRTVVNSTEAVHKLLGARL